MLDAQYVSSRIQNEITEARNDPIVRNLLKELNASICYTETV